MDQGDLAQYRDKWLSLVNDVINLKVLGNEGHFLTSRRTISFYRRTQVHGVNNNNNNSNKIHD